MYFPISNPQPLPLALPEAHADTRAEIAGLKLADAAMLEFNFHLHDVSRAAPSVAAGQIVELADWLRSLPEDTAQATINLRLARVESLRRMLEDADWSLPEDFARRGRRLLDYICQLDDLIPDEIPLLGHLDDALLVELSWAEFADEVNDYLDFCRFCSESRVRGSQAERRSAWESECLAEASTLLHRQSIRERGYARPKAITRPFRVH